jgi:hypothetical protein
MSRPHVEHRHRIVLALPVEVAFPLFTPKGEEAWAPGWAPEYLFPADGETREGMVFRTFHGGETTLWGCVDYRPQEHVVRYARVNPETRFAFVEVECRAIGPATTEVEVGYAQTAVSPAGEGVLAETTEAAFAATIDGWRVEIEAALARAS